MSDTTTPWKPDLTIRFDATHTMHGLARLRWTDDSVDLAVLPRDRSVEERWPARWVGPVTGRDEANAVAELIHQLHKQDIPYVSGEADRIGKAIARSLQEWRRAGAKKCADGHAQPESPHPGRNLCAWPRCETVAGSARDSDDLTEVVREPMDRERAIDGYLDVYGNWQRRETSFALEWNLLGKERRPSRSV